MELTSPLFQCLYWVQKYSRCSLRIRIYFITIVLPPKWCIQGIYLNAAMQCYVNIFLMRQARHNLQWCTIFIHIHVIYSLRWINKVTQVVFVCLVCNPFRRVGYLFKGLPMLLWLEGKLKSVCIQHHHPWCWTWVACQINVTLSGNALAQSHCRHL